CVLFFFSSRRRHTRSKRDWSSDVCSSDLALPYPFDRAGLTCRLEHRGPFRDLVLHERRQRLRAAVGGYRDHAAEFEQALADVLEIGRASSRAGGGGTRRES